MGGEWGMYRGARTQDELLRRGQHVQREGDFVLVPLALEPFEEGGWVEGEGEEEGGGEGEEEEGGGGGEVVEHLGRGAARRGDW